ncbi:hypothetical protein [Actibacterium sp. 188UL27-1]|uniref:hypothetical protein n=1 Tax=Actibacterium sp. 188UL27-1 TaxID=2786961 RepID=UPI001956E773|nr:hypothetical protein [Actibacterium sp. 188UL27-1]MBM7068643.1 hypothetical protein [Actibacterium sp. 188UL27-1]
MDSVYDWIDLHDISVELASDVLLAHQSRALPVALPWIADKVDQPPRRCCLPDLETCLNTLVAPSLGRLLGDIGAVQAIVETVDICPLGENPATLPHTRDLGRDKPPVIAIHWQGTAADLLCLAHEAAHAIQIVWSDHAMMPPVARETCAFLGELALIEGVRANNPEQASDLAAAWITDNILYLGKHVEALEQVLRDPSHPYHYQINYPFARLAAIFLFWRAKKRQKRIANLFQSGAAGMAHLPLHAMAAWACHPTNCLPAAPLADQSPSGDAYRNLAMIAHLDLQASGSEHSLSIGDYYARILAHFQTGTAFIALDGLNRPVGYATWDQTEQKAPLALCNQVAPFGDHLAVQRTLERHLDGLHPIAARHPESMKSEQKAW